MQGTIWRRMQGGLLAWGLTLGLQAQTPAEVLSIANLRTIAQRLHSNLDATERKTISPEPIVSESTPQVVLRTTTAGSQCAVRISPATVDLIDRVALAMAINRVERGYLQSYLNRLAQFQGTESPPELPARSKARQDRLDLINDHLSNFNQVFAGLISIALNLPASDTQNPSPDHWLKALRKGVSNSLACAYGTEGLADFFDALESLPTRPAWVGQFVPAGIKARKIRKELERINHEVLK